MALLSQSLILLFLSVGVSLSQCPPREDILPCSCRDSFNSWDNFNIKVVCWKVDDVDDLRRALLSVKGIQNVAFEFRRSNLGSVPSDLFKGLHVVELHFDSCKLKRIGDEGRSALEGLEDSIKIFSVQWSFSEDNSLTFLNVSSLRMIEYLKIGMNNVKELGDEWFADGPASLKDLDMAVNKITRLGDRAFAQLINLQELWSGHNQIKTVTRSMLPSPAAHLEVIHLTDNMISSLPNDMFSNMPVLRIVFLNQNSIQRIPEATWIPVWSKLGLLDLNNNPLDCDADFDWTLQKSRPEELKGTCASPDERKYVDLKTIIDKKQH